MNYALARVSFLSTKYFKVKITSSIITFARFFFIVSAVLLSYSVKSQKNLSYFLPDVQTLNPEITTPEEFLGFQIGEWHVTHTQQVYYMKKLAEESDRIQFHSMGKSHEDRPLVHLYISRPDNLQRLEEIRQNQLNWSDPMSDQTAPQEELPLVVWQGYSIHGNEASGSNAALLVAYYLAASDNPEILKILDNTVIIFYPSFNPDGMQRFSSWVNMNKSKTLNPDNQDREYDEVWPGGRTNHYGFDLNRDWLPVQQPESQAKIKLYQMWRPNILTDHHEMGTNSTFFFQPGIPSRTNPLTPQINQDLTEEIGTFHATALDSIGSLYYSKESFDDFYYGKGSTYPDIQGSIGILFEQGSSRGHIQHSDHGILTFPFTIRNQFVTSLSTLQAGLSLKNDLQKYQRDFFHSQDYSGSEGYVFGHKSYPHKTQELAKILQLHDINIFRLTKELTHGDHSYSVDDAYYVPLDQRQKQLIRTIFETNTTFQDSLFYDVSAWTLPLAFDLPYDLVQEPSSLENVLQPVSSEKATFTTSDYAYILPWEHYLAPRVLYQLLDEGIRAFVGTQPFTYDGHHFNYGSVLIPVQNQDKEAIESILKKAVEQEGVPVIGIPTGATGMVNLGSRNFAKVVKPKIGLIVGNGASAYSSGEVWHLLDTRYHIPVTRLDGEKFSSYNLDEYNVLVLTAGSIRGVSKEKLQQWISRGGTFIVQGSAGRWADRQFPGHFIYKKSVSIDTTSAGYDEMSDLYGARVTGGAIVKTKIDRSHPLNFGYLEDVLPLFKKGNHVFEADPLAYKNPIVYADDPLWSGYLHESNIKLFSGSSAVQVAAIGSGRIINFADNPNFRAFWYGTNKLFANSIFFGRLISSRASN